jgi:hypothetical protein
LDEKTNAENRYTLAIPVDGHPMGWYGLFSVVWMEIYYVWLFVCSQSVDKDKADSEQMAVRTAEKLLKVSLCILLS